MANPKKREITDQHKAALATGRTQGRAVKAYLDALENNRPKRGRKRTPESIGKRLAVIDAEYDEAEPLKKLAFVQERLDLEAELKTLESKVDISALEDDFVKVAQAYSNSKGYTYEAWRAIGVAADVLKRAGISR